MTSISEIEFQLDGGRVLSDENAVLMNNYATGHAQYRWPDYHKTAHVR